MEYPMIDVTYIYIHDMIAYRSQKVNNFSLAP